jgi:uncharacterized SAM-binding protein YcdF (DUF218 family)
MPLAADYPFLEAIWTIFIFFVWIAWIFLLVRILIDVFRRRDASGWKKGAWVAFLILVPFVGVLAYLITNGSEMGERDLEQARASKAQFDEYVRQTAGSGGGAAAEIAKAKELLDSGAITQAEFDQLKQRALGS